MWVEITREMGFLRPYKGVLESSPAFIEDLEPGEEIVFNPCHIARTIIKKGDPRWIDSANLRAMVSEMCFAEGECVRFLYRQAADRKGDSGWRMFTGHEPPDYSEDPNNMRLPEVGYMLDLDPTLLEPLKADIGAAFERKDQDQPWRQVPDWTPPE